MPLPGRPGAAGSHREPPKGCQGLPKGHVACGSGTGGRRRAEAAQQAIQDRAQPGTAGDYREDAKSLPVYQRIGTPKRPWSVVTAAVPQVRAGLALPISNEQFGADFRSKRVIHVLEPDQLSLQVAYSLLKAAHLRDDAGIWPADVAE